MNFFFQLWNLDQILNIFEEKMAVIANVFPKSKTVKTSVDHSLKSAVSGPPSRVTVLMGAKHL